MHTISGAQWWLLVASFTMTCIAATGVYEALFVQPKWFADTPKSLALMRSQDTIKYWIPIQLVSIVALVGTSLTNWNKGGIHTALLTALVSYILVWVSTFVFFVPGVIKFGKVNIEEPAEPGLAERGKRWLRLSWLRQLAMVVSAVSLAIALAAA
jgi:hypothetical protein